MTFLIIGPVLTIFTAYQQRYAFNLFPPEWRFPNLGPGIALFCIGLGLIIVYVILKREYRLRKAEMSETTP